MGEHQEHPASDIYICRRVLDIGTFVYATEGIRRAMGPNARVTLRPVQQAAITLLAQSTMRYALRRSERLRKLSAEEIRAALFEAYPSSIQDKKFATFDELTTFEGQAGYHIAAIVDDPDITDELQTGRECLSKLAGKNIGLYTGDDCTTHVSFAVVPKLPSNRTLQRFAEYTPAGLLVSNAVPIPEDTHLPEAA